MGYVTLYKGSLLNDVLIMNYLKKLKVEFIYKNGYFFMEDEVFHGLAKKCSQQVILQNIDMADLEVEYHILVNHLPIGLWKVNRLFDDYMFIEYKASQDFNVPESGYFPRGNLISLYFISEKVSSPLDVIWELGTHLRISQKYYMILFDYTPTASGIIYQFLFQFSQNNFQKNLEEIIQIRKSITELDWKEIKVVTGANDYPVIFNQFQNIYLKNYPVYQSTSFKIELWGATVFMPGEMEFIQKVKNAILTQI